MGVTLRPLRVLRSRAVAALLITGCTSTSGLVIAVSVARTSTVTTTGQFGIAASVLLLLGALARSGGIDPLVVVARSHEDVRHLGRASSIALAGAVLIAVAAVVLGSSWLVVVAVAAHGVVLRECVRAAAVARGRTRRVAVIEFAATVVSVLAAAGALCGMWTAFAAFTASSLIGSVIGYVSVALHRADIMPAWKRFPVGSRRSASFIGDTLIGSGTVQASTWLAASVGGLVIAGGIRGAGTLAGPVTVALTAIRSVLLPRAVAHASAPNGLRRLAHDTLGMAALAAPFVAVLAFFPSELGRALLGGTWRFVAPVTALVASELLLQVVAAPAEAAHRVSASDRRILSIRATLAAVRLVGVFVAAPHGLGAVLAAALLTTALGAIVQWSSLVGLRRTSSTIVEHTSPKQEIIGS